MRAPIPSLFAVATLAVAISVAGGCASDALDTSALQTRDIDVDTFRFDAHTAGPEDGELVLLLHGFPQTSLEWRAQLQALGDAGYFAVAPNQRGYSERARPTTVDAYDYKLLVDDVLAMADALGRARFHLVGHDWGAVVAWGVAAEAPDRVTSLTAVSIPHPDAFAAALGDPSSCQYEASSYFETFTADGTAANLLAGDAFLLRNVVWGDLDPAAEEAYLEVLGTEEALGAALNWYRANITGRQLRPEPIGPVAVDTLFIWSDGDTAICTEPAEDTANHVDGPYRFEVLSNVDHWIPERAPDEVNALLLEHLGKDRQAETSADDSE